MYIKKDEGNLLFSYSCII